MPPNPLPRLTLRYQANLSFSAKIKGCPVGHPFIFDSSLYVGEIRTKASRKQSCELFLAATEAIRKACAFIRLNCFEDGKNESLLLRCFKAMRGDLRGFARTRNKVITAQLLPHKATHKPQNKRHSEECLFRQLILGNITIELFININLDRCL